MKLLKKRKKDKTLNNTSNKTLNKTLLLGVFALTAVAIVGCGSPQEDYQAANKALEETKTAKYDATISVEVDEESNDSYLAPIFEKETTYSAEVDQENGKYQLDLNVESISGSSYVTPVVVDQSEEKILLGSVMFLEGFEDEIVKTFENKYVDTTESYRLLYLFEEEKKILSFSPELIEEVEEERFTKENDQVTFTLKEPSMADVEHLLVGSELLFYKDNITLGDVTVEATLEGGNKIKQQTITMPMTMDDGIEKIAMTTSLTLDVTSVDEAVKIGVDESDVITEAELYDVLLGSPPGEEGGQEIPEFYRVGDEAVDQDLAITVTRAAYVENSEDESDEGLLQLEVKIDNNRDEAVTIEPSAFTLSDTFFNPLALADDDRFTYVSGEVDPSASLTGTLVFSVPLDGMYSLNYTDVSGNVDTIIDWEIIVE